MTNDSVHVARHTPESIMLQIFLSELARNGVRQESMHVVAVSRQGKGRRERVMTTVAFGYRGGRYESTASALVRKPTNLRSEGEMVRVGNSIF